MVHSSACRAPAAIAVIVFVGCCIKRVEGHWLVVAGAVVVAIVFTIAVVGVVFAIIFMEVQGSSSSWKLLSSRESGVIVAIVFTVTVASVIFAIDFVGVVVLAEDVILAGVGGHSWRSRRRRNRLLRRRCGCRLRNRPRGSHHLHGSCRPRRSRRHRCDHSPQRTQLGAASAEPPWLVGHAARRVCVGSVPPVVVAVAVVVVVAGGGHSLELR